MSCGEGRTKHLQIITLEADRLVHMLKESTRSRDENVHARKPLPFVFQALSTNHEACREAVVSANATQHFENLDRLPDVGEHDITRHGIHSPVLSLEI